MTDPHAGETLDSGIAIIGMAGRFPGARNIADFWRNLRDGVESVVRYTDAELGRLIGALRDSGIYDGALIVVTSDHGEEFWEHGNFEHGQSL